VPRELLQAPAPRVAPLLLGTFLVSGEGTGRVVVRVDEVEAYAGVGEDPGSHAHRGPRPRNATMFARPGALYAYFTYGMHWCLNVVAHPVGVGEPSADASEARAPEGGAAEGGAAGPAGAVLLRAGEVVEGVALARSRRTAARRDVDLARGPARLAVALGLTGEQDGADLLDPVGPVQLLAGPAPVEVSVGPRVGVAGDGATTPWRWWDARSAHVSDYRAAQPRARRSGPQAPGRSGPRSTDSTSPAGGVP